MVDPQPETPAGLLPPGSLPPGRTAAPVADAAAWLARQGIEVPASSSRAGPVRGTGSGGHGPRPVRRARVLAQPGERFTAAAENLDDEVPPRDWDREDPTDDSNRLDPAEDRDRSEPAERRDRERSAESGKRERRARETNRVGPADGDADPYEVARSIALRKLTGQDRTRHELAQALRARNVPDEVGEKVLDRLEEVGLVNDAAFAKAWVESRQQRRHLSRPALRRELQAKGVDRDDIDLALDAVDFGDELMAARDLARRRYPTLAGHPYPVRYRRLAGVLGRRGFSTTIVAQVLREIVTDD